MGILSPHKEIAMNSAAELEGRLPFTPDRLEEIAKLWECVAEGTREMPVGVDVSFARQRATIARGVSRHMTALGIDQRRNIGPFQLDTIPPATKAVLRAGKSFGTTSKRKSPSKDDIHLIVRRTEAGWTVDAHDDLRRSVVDPKVTWTENGYHFWASIEDLEIERLKGDAA
jgi:hypothetical protein